MEALLSDIRYLWASMRRDARFAATALITIALGVGATSAVFSIVYAVLLRPLPYPDPDRLVTLYEEHPGGVAASGDRLLSNTTLYAWRTRMETIEDVAAYGPREYSVRLQGETTRMHGGELSAAAFSLLGARSEAGRVFVAADDAPNAAPVAIISDRMWHEQFGGRSDAIGQSIAIDDRAHEIVGVAMPGFHFPDRDAEIWTPFDDPTRLNPAIQGGMWLLQAVGRLKPTASLAQVEAEGTAAARSVSRPPVARELFGAGGPVVVHAGLLAGGLTSGVRPVLVVLATSVALVLFVACANVANLFLSRGVTRQRELALRTAIGANLGRLVRQLLTESLMLSICGGAIGLALAAGALRVAPTLAPHGFPRLETIRFDATVVVFAIISSLVTALVSGLAPALHGARFELSAILRGGDGATAGGFRSARARRLRGALLVSESALAALLIVGAALLGRSFVRLVRVDAGYNPSHVLVARVFPPGDFGHDRSQQFVESLVDRIRGDGRIVAAGAGNMMPFADSTWITAFDVPGTLGNGKATHVRAVLYMVTSGYAEALGLRLREGRFLTGDDRRPGQLPAVVNAEFARQFLSAGRVTGRVFAGGPFRAPATEIVGVVDDVLREGHNAQAQPEIYTLAADGARAIRGEVDVVMRTSGEPGAAASMLRDAVRVLEPRAAVGDVLPLADRVSASMAQPRLATAVLWSFAGLALALAGVGLYGVLSYAVSQRQREFCVRFALGAAKRDLVRLVVREGLALTVAGTVLGLAAATVLTRLMTGLLFGITPLDGWSYLAAPAVLMPVATIACLLPALRAAAISPARAFRDE